MFDDLRPDEIPAPPPNALNAAVHRGTSIRRRRRTAWVAGVATAVVVGIAVVLSNPFSTTDSAQVVPATSSPAPKDYTPIPDNASTADGVSFGFLEKMTQNPDGGLTLRIQPGYYLTGDEAIAANGGEYPADDYVSGEKKGTSPTDLVLDPKASLVGENVFLGNPDETVTEGKAVTAALMKKSWDAYDKDYGPTQIGVWFRQSDDGTISALREQYTP